jgi:hypothetical protein
MFDSARKLSARLSDAVDLVIDFATLGEYGLEPAPAPCRCGARRQREGRPSAGFAAVDRGNHLAARL